MSTTFQKRPLGAALLWDGGLRAMQSSMGVFALAVMPTTRPPPRSTSITVSKDERMGVKPLDVGGVDDSPLNRPLRTHLEGYPMLASLNIFPYYFRTDKKKAPGVSAKCLIPLQNLVGANGLEPSTPTMSRWCSNQLSYAPATFKFYQCGGTVICVGRGARRPPAPAAIAPAPGGSCR